MRFDSGRRQAAIAVIIPCHNGARFLSRAIESALVQTRAPSMIYIVDDASTDETPEIARHFAANHPNVRWIRLEENVGPASARNAAIELATEDYLAFLDADDYWLPDHTARLAALLDAHPMAAVAFGRVDARGGDPPDAPAVEPASPVNILRTLLVDNLIPQSATLARRSAVLGVGAYREGARYAEDYDLWLRLALEHDFIFSDRATAVRHLHDGQATLRVKQMSYGAWEARRRLWERGRRMGHLFSDTIFRAACRAAYELHLAGAWRDRDPNHLRATIQLADRVPDGTEVLRRWRWRMIFVHPIWRLAAAIWDRLPEFVRRPLRRRRTARARERAYALRMAPEAAGHTHRLVASGHEAIPGR